jgi:hypothetical protein
MRGLKSRFLGHHFTSKYNNPGVFKDTASKQLSLKSPGLLSRRVASLDGKIFDPII